jgi:hypothetical protein
MSFVWETYLIVAEILLGIRTPSFPTAAERAMVEEAHCRIAISRAYYAAYCAARNYSRDVESLPLRGGGEDHGAVIRHYARRTRRHRVIAVALRRLRDARNQADYDDTISQNLRAMAEEAILDAHEVLETLRRLQP